ncbi:MAG: bifunctional 23S rRNA (guanine(2069)-N(7))-methyltransferase RlmK/23S rRNA (guanine(2445)-N(2))-methyltransferase RlmL [Desulfuromonadales bacterium]|nr:bifunctional 23S rRNA (guanine(2069)-N(7))-methyltransferase RlmK/23S rRNA (guanine(2445)-N(2))-methyltransferase RlmL [Desulfuromonadales bacterium]MBN2791049.1 bifunctional 23S rRNA (guanine(2069)-N(7))-methyltransferase RlmK/23S rRNA (guanine(2445)-N(2))-methyltransferase RlmL [Desulfuromonadales bacterium]
MDKKDFFVTAALGLEPLLAAELIQLGADDVGEVRAGVRFQGSLATAYRVCLWSRLASRILLPLGEFAAADADQLYTGALNLDWTEHLTTDRTFAVDCTLVNATITHTRYAALRVKDAIVDQFRSRVGLRPSVAVERPDVRVNLHIVRDRATLSIDLSGESLHRRGYRVDGVHAPLKENLAAAILIRAGWPDIAAAGGALIDPLCGSGSLPIEAALMASDSAPGLLRSYYGFSGWVQHRQVAWNELLEEARTRQQQGMAQLRNLIVGFDEDRRAIKAAWQHAEKAGLEKNIHFERRSLSEFSVPAVNNKGLVVANPPYGERLGSEADLAGLYNQLGEKMAGHCRGWHAAVITSSKQLGRSIGLRADKINVLYNGALKCQLLQFDLDEGNHWQSLENGAGRAVKKTLSPGGQMFANRLRKNLKKYAKWAKREQIDCFRVYDADLPEYAVAVDLYADEVHLQEYQAPKDIDVNKAAARLQDVLEALPQVLDIAADKIHLKTRRPQKGRQQYQKQARRGIFKEVREGNCRFLVNLSDYLDTGLFLDHRLTRQMIQQLAAGKRFLNLFGYTGAATVHALMGGALTTTTVDMSATYLDWAGKNFKLNRFDPAAERLIQADCLAWLESAAEVFDLIFLDPPTFSNSKTMDGTFDVQRDHVALLNKVVTLLAPEGTLVFSNNLRKFKMDFSALSHLQIEDITNRTIPYDYERNPRIHNCWMIKRLE